MINYKHHKPYMINQNEPPKWTTISRLIFPQDPVHINVGARQLRTAHTIKQYVEVLQDCGIFSLQISRGSSGARPAHVNTKEAINMSSFPCFFSQPSDGWSLWVMLATWCFRIYQQRSIGNHKWSIPWDGPMAIFEENGRTALRSRFNPKSS